MTSGTILFGKNGQLGWELRRALLPLAPLTSFGREEVDLSDPDSLRRVLETASPAVIVNAAAYTAVDKAESEADEAVRINETAVGVMADHAASTGALLVHYSTDYVFDGRKIGPYDEDDVASPLGVYGRSKLAGEERVRASGCRHLILRSSWIFSTRGSNFPKAILRRAMEHDELRVVSDCYGAPTSASLIADVTALALHGCPCGTPLSDGTYHLVAAGRTSWYEYAKFLIRVARAHGLPVKAVPNRIFPVSVASIGAPAARPMNSTLSTSRIEKALKLRLPDWRDHVTRLIEELATRSL